MDKPIRVLFLCTGNSCRSQMAEGWLRTLGGERYLAESAGTHPQGVHLRAVASMRRAGVDISQQTSKSIDAFLADPPDLVITVCDKARGACPMLPGTTNVQDWSFPDPVAATGTDEEIDAVFDEVRDAIKKRVRTWLKAGTLLGCLPSL